MAKEKIHIKIIWANEYANIDWLLLCSLFEAPETSEWISIDMIKVCHGTEKDWEAPITDDLYDYSAE